MLSAGATAPKCSASSLLCGALLSCSWPTGDPLRRAWGFNPLLTRKRQPAAGAPAPHATPTKALAKGSACATPNLLRVLASTSTATGSKDAFGSAATKAAAATAAKLVASLSSALCALLASDARAPQPGVAGADAPPPTPAAARQLLHSALQGLVALANLTTQPPSPAASTATLLPPPAADPDALAAAAPQGPPAHCTLVLTEALAAQQQQQQAAGSASTAALSAFARTVQQQQQAAGGGALPSPMLANDVLRLQRIVRVGNLDGRGSGGAASRGTRGGGAAASRGGRGGASAGDAEWSASNLPAEHAEAVENGVAMRSCVSLCGASGLLAVARGTYIGFLDAQQHVLEMVAPALAAACKEGGGGGAGAASSSSSSSAAVVPAQKSSYSLLQRHNARFTVLSLAYDCYLGRHLAVVGLRELQVRTRR